MIPFLGILCAAIGIGIFLAIRGGSLWRSLPVLVGWLGSWLIVLGLIFMPFLRLGTSAGLQANARWLVEQAELIQVIYRLPNAEQWLPPLPELSAEKFIADLEAPNKELILEDITSQKPITGVHLIRLAQPIKPLLSLSLAFSGLLALAGIAYFGARLFSPGGISGRVGLVISLASGLLLVMLISYIATIDTLGQTDELRLRLLLVLAEARMGSGLWIEIFGLALCLAGGLLGFQTQAMQSKADDDEAYA